MRLSRFPKILLIPVLLGSAVHVAPAQGVDQFGQAPPAALRKRVDKAVDKSKTDVGAATKQLTAVVKEDPNYYRAQRNLGLIQIQQGQNKEAAETLGKAADLQSRDDVSDPRIYAELGFAQSRAGLIKEAEATFVKGIDVIGELEPKDQEKLLTRAIAFQLEYQNPTGARALYEKAEPALAPEAAARTTQFLEEGIQRLTAADVPEGWVKLGSLKTADSNELTRQLFVSADGQAGTPGVGDTVTPNTVVNIRAEKLNPANTESPLGAWSGFARIGEKFKILELEKIPSGTTIAIWIRVQRE